jgi:uncharacterized protein DUF4846
VKSLLIVWMVAALSSPQVRQPSYSWLSQPSGTETLASRIAPPTGFERETVPSGSFGEWLRNLPLKKGQPEVRLFDGRLKGNQGAHVAVVDIDTGNKDLQQCADAVIRLRAEYLYSKNDFAGIHFNFTSGDPAQFVKWTEGFRPVVHGSRVSWAKSASPDTSYRSFRSYLNTVFTYSGTASLERELRKVTNVRDLRAGDVFIQPGYPGHAVLVVDVARDPRTGRRAFLLAQSYMPAQDIHILRNPRGGALGAWYESDFGATLSTPEWTFSSTHLRRFPEQ